MGAALTATPHPHAPGQMQAQTQTPAPLSSFAAGDGICGRLGSALGGDGLRARVDVDTHGGIDNLDVPYPIQRYHREHGPVRRPASPACSARSPSLVLLSHRKKCVSPPLQLAPPTHCLRSFSPTACASPLLSSLLCLLTVFGPSLSQFEVCLPASPACSAHSLSSVLPPHSLKCVVPPLQLASFTHCLWLFPLTEQCVLFYPLITSSFLIRGFSALREFVIIIVTLFFGSNFLPCFLLTYSGCVCL
ncbi:hypothetical protein CCMSSC00406_0009260 [Pleurotus cornucopiae]|uniref:Uncharacterized protein n=1 Tax=Pleurotus cornucopiae TaxID=5321 RepID=A0ACB7J036_PLECO|nr:hypothetical protein CCMSSC00406_0009260 [Pleurotus cornucopiae]